MMLNSIMYSKWAQYFHRCRSARQTQTHKLSLSREGDLHMLVGAWRWWRSAHNLRPLLLSRKVSLSSTCSLSRAFFIVLRADLRVVFNARPYSFLWVLMRFQRSCCVLAFPPVISGLNGFLCHVFISLCFWARMRNNQKRIHDLPPANTHTCPHTLSNDSSDFHQSGSSLVPWSVLPTLRIEIQQVLYTNIISNTV